MNTMISAILRRKGSLKRKGSAMHGISLGETVVVREEDHVKNAVRG